MSTVKVACLILAEAAGSGKVLTLTGRAAQAKVLLCLVVGSNAFARLNQRASTLSLQLFNNCRIKIFGSSVRSPGSHAHVTKLSSVPNSSVHYMIQRSLIRVAKRRFAVHRFLHTYRAKAVAELSEENGSDDDCCALRN